MKTKKTARISPTMRWAVIGIVSVSGMAALWLSGCNRGDADVGANLTADMAVARKHSFEITTTASGQLEAKDEIEIRSKVESRTTIVELAKEGTRVKPGDLLVQLASDQIDKLIVDETARVQSSRSDLITAENNVAMQEIENASRLRKAELKFDLAKSAMDQWKQGDVAIKRMMLDLDVEKADRELKRAEERLKQSEALIKKDFLSKEDFQKDQIAKIEWDAASMKAKKAREVYNDYEYVKDEKIKQGDVDDSVAELARVKLQNEKELAVKKADLENKREQLRIRESNLTKLQDQLKNCTITAPREGLVVYATSMGMGRWDQGSLQVGKEVQNNEHILSLPDTTEMIASVKVHESLAGRVRPGMLATVKVDAAGGRTFSGAVTSIGVLAESSGWRDPNLREYTVKISLDKTDDIANLKPSMRADATIVLGSVEDVLSVPVQAVFNEGPVRFVYVADGSKFVRVPVQLGRRSDVLAEITSGLSLGSTVLLREPSAGEIINRPWSKDELKLAGYQLNENGQPMEVNAMPADFQLTNMPAGGGGGSAQMKGGPGGRPPRGAGGPGGGGGGNNGRRTKNNGGGGDKAAKPADTTTTETKPADSSSTESTSDSSTTKPSK